MSAVSKFIGTVAGIAALIPGPHQPIAAAVAVAANVTAQLTAKKPPAMSGSVNRISIGANQPKPYLIGETYYGGNRINQEGFGGKVSKVNNPYMVLVDVYSGAGPVAGFVAPYLDFVPVTLNGNAAAGYAANHLYVYHQLGRTPEPAALSTHWNGAQTWGPQHKLSSYAAISWCLRFDEDGKRFAAGVPQTGAVWRGVLCYDPRKDSTYPGGSGPHRWADPTDTAAFAAAKATWEWSRCPGLHGLRYALGTWERDESNPDARYRKTFGPGIPIDGIRVADFVALANVCDANGWKVDGVIHEPGNRDDNMKNILAAGGAERCWIGGKLGLKLSAPRVALDTITEYDLANDEVEAGAMQGWESRLNTIVPKFRSPDHKWEYVPSTAVTIASYLAEDGEEKAEERQYNLVQSKDQAAQLAAYELLDARELGEIVLTCKSRMRRYGAGDLLTVHLPDDGLVNQPCVVLKRTVDPVSMTVELILRGETAAKHDFALGRTGTAPPTPRLVTGEVLDDVAVDAPIAWDSITGPGKPEDNATVGMTPAEREYYDGIASDLESILSDGVLNRGSEKLTLLRIYDDLIADSAAAHAQSVALGEQYGGDPTVAERVARDSAVGALVNYLSSLSPPWNQTDVDTPVDAAALRDRFSAARNTTAALARANETFISGKTAEALALIRAISRDSVLSRGEKRSTKVEWANVYNESAALKSRWQALGSPVTIKPTLDAQDNAVGALSTYLGNLTPRWDDATQDTPIDPAAWDSAWQTALVALSASRSALYAYTATTAQWDGVDNKPYSRLFTNLLDTLPWVPGAKDSIGRFSQNGGSGQNEIVLDQGPGGISEPILRMVAGPGQGSVPGDNAGSPCGGWNYDAYKDRGEYDPRKTYRYMVWAKRAPGANGPIYLGTGGRILTVEGVADTNPYFWVGDFEGDGQNNLPAKGKWYLIVGVLHGCDYTGGQSGVSGVYDPNTGKRLLPGNDFKSHPEATLLVHRAYQYYAQAGSTSFFARPSLEEVTSATVSVEQIFATVGMTTLQAAALAEAQNAIIAIGSDAVLSKGEKERTVRDYVALSNETDTLHDRFVALGSPAEATDAINALITARDNLGGYLNTLSPPWSDATQDTSIDPPTWANRWDVAYDRLAKARAAITGRKGDKGDKGEDGVNPLTAYLTNESFTHPTNAAGAPVEIAGGIGDGQMRVFLGTQDVTPQCSFTAQLPYNLALTVDQFGSYVSTALYDDQGYAFVIASYQGLAISKRVSASRSKGGTDGTSPPIVRVIASDQSFSLDTAGNAKAKTVKLTASAQNTSAQVLWAAFRADGHQYTSWLDAATLAAQGWLTRSIDNLNVEIDQDTFNALANAYGETITFGVLLQGTDVSDRVSIVRLRDGAKGADGAAGLAVFLTNPSHTVPANSAGAVTSYAGSAFSIVVMAGGENVTSSFAIESTDNPQGLSVPGNYPNYYVDGGLDAAEATAVLTLNLLGSGRFANVRLSTVYSIGKSIAGANGAAPPLLTVQASGQAIVTNADGSLVANTALTFSATRQNTDAAVTWAVFDGAGAQHRTYNGLSFTTDAADLLAIINYPAAVGQPNTRFCTVKAACGSVSDFVTVWAVRNGENGAAGVSPFALDLGSAAIVLNATYAGVTKPGQLPRNVAVSVKQGTTDAIGAVAIGISTSTGIAASYANGVVSITTADADGYVEVSASQGGVNVVAPKRISISRSLDAPPPQTATGVTQRGYNGDPNNTSYLSGPSGKIVTVGVPANGVLPIEIYLEYSVLENQSFAFRTYAAAAKIVYRPVGSGAAWSDLISEVSGTIAQWSRSTQEYEQGELNYPSSVNLPGGQAFEFALMLRKHSGNGSAQYVDGFMRIGE